MNALCDTTIIFTQPTQDVYKTNLTNVQYFPGDVLTSFH